MIKTFIKRASIAVLSLLIVVALSGFAYYKYNESPQVFKPSVAGLYHQGERPTAAESKVKLGQGALIGFSDNYNTFAWLGIPYAKAPVDDLRWRAPRSHSGWDGLLEAIEYRQPCVQFWGVLAGVKGQEGDLVGSEDCLSLNVWAPQNASKKSKKPTMVWIHGGGNDSGTGSVYQGHHLAGSQDVVVVTINYRVGLLGWFSHQALRDNAQTPEDASGNYGTLDIIHALKWVRSNIAEFGGDPDNVTIFGESAGARNVYSMLASPLAKGLFHKAIVQSGTVDTTLQTLAEDFPEEPNTKAIAGLKNSSNALIELVLKRQQPEAKSAELRAQIGAMNATELLALMRAQSPETLMRLASENSGSKAGYIRVARVIRDGHVLPKESLLTLFKDTERYNDVPLITGTTRDEQKVFMARNPEYVDFKLGAIPVIKEPERYQAVSDYVSRNWKAGAVDEPAKVITANQGKNVYAYRFDWDDMMQNALVDLPSVLGAAHGMETNYVFGDFIGGMPFQITHNRANANGRETLARTMMSYWANFAYTGAPSRGRDNDLPEWKAWAAQGSNLLLLDAPKSGGARMAEVRTNVADLKQQLLGDTVISSQKDKCQAYASLFLHGYQTSDFYRESEYQALGCADYPVGSFR